MDERQQKHLEPHRALQAIARLQSKDTRGAFPAHALEHPLHRLLIRLVQHRRETGAAKLAAEHLANARACQAKHVLGTRQPLENEGLGQDAGDARWLDIETPGGDTIAPRSSPQIFR
mgnify:CR=1 FL=1